jgi:thiamine kinase-like enzyme
MLQASTLHLNIPIHQIIEYVHKGLQRQEMLHTIKIAPLTGGYVASSVYRLDLEFGDAAVHSFVQKYADVSEIRVMKRLQDDLALAEIPPVVSASTENDWFVMPFYEGRPLDFDDDLPLAIIKALATIHAFYGTRTEQIDWLPQVNAAFIEGLVRYIIKCLNDNRERFSTSIYTEVYNQLQAADIAPTLDKTFQRLPKTLIHGDVHSGNVIRTAAGSYILFDWGNARVAPGMLDIANMVEMGSETWNAYVRALEAASGKAVDLEIAYVWATAVVNLQYLPFAIGQLEPGTAQEMLEKLRAALTVLQEFRSKQS